jgi:hypothetical protein
MDRRIVVVDAWLYDGPEIDLDRTKGAVVCKIDLANSILDYVEKIDDVIQGAVDNAKASGTKIQLILSNYRIMTYAQMGTKTYENLLGIKYNQLGITK